jgi:hypothetical protein
MQVNHVELTCGRGIADPCAGRFAVHDAVTNATIEPAGEEPALATWFFGARGSVAFL